MRGHFKPLALNCQELQDFYSKVEKSVDITVKFNLQSIITTDTKSSTLINLDINHQLSDVYLILTHNTIFGQISAVLLIIISESILVIIKQGEESGEASPGYYQHRS